MKWLALAVLLAVVQTNPPVPRKAADANTSKGQPIQNDTNADKKTSNETTPVVQTGQPPPAQNTNPDNGANDAEKTIRVRELPPVSVTRDWMDCLTLMFSAILLGVGIVGVYAAYKTLGEMKVQRETMQGQLTAMQNQFTEMKRQNDIIISKERLRISMDDPEKLSFPFAGPHRVQFALTFSGTTTGDILKSFATVGISDSRKTQPEDPIFAPKITNLPSKINPAEKKTFNASAWFVPRITISKNEVDEIVAGVKFVHFWGFVRFTDAFFDVSHIERTMRFHYVWIYTEMKNLGSPSGDPPFGFWDGKYEEEEKCEGKAN
jgi:hypothetical protein